MSHFMGLSLRAAMGTFTGQPLRAGQTAILRSVILRQAAALSSKSPQGATLTTLYSFCAQTNCTDGALPYGGLVLATNGNFYGTTRRGGTGSACGSYGCGTVFEITPGGTLTTLHSFDRYPDGAFPIAGLVQATSGNFYSTTPGGVTQTAPAAPMAVARSSKSPPAAS